MSDSNDRILTYSEFFEIKLAFRVVIVSLSYFFDKSWDLADFILTGFNPFESFTNYLRIGRHCLFLFVYY